MSSANGDFDLTMDEVRDVVRFAADCAQRLIPEFAAESPEDSRPRDALNAARAFAEGAARTNLQRTTAPVNLCSQTSLAATAGGSRKRVSG